MSAKEFNPITARTETTLDPRQRAALTAAAIGLTGSAAARGFGISCRTLRRAQLTAVVRLGAYNLTHAVALAVAADLLEKAPLRTRTLPDWPASRMGPARGRRGRPLKPRGRAAQPPGVANTGDGLDAALTFAGGDRSSGGPGRSAAEVRGV